MDSQMQLEYSQILSFVDLYWSEFCIVQFYYCSAKISKLIIDSLNMKTKTISFSQMLKNKGKSPEAPFHKGKTTLRELMELWLDNPDEDYTLQMDSMSLSQRSKQSSTRMFTSRISNEPQQEMFDSWIQKQSFISNKENITEISRRKTMNTNGKMEFSNRVVPQPYGMESVKHKPMAAFSRFSEMKNMEQSNQLKYTSQTKMQSNMGENGFKSVGFKAALKSVKQPDRNLTIQFEKVAEKHISKPKDTIHQQERKSFKAPENISSKDNIIAEAHSITYSKQETKKEEPISVHVQPPKILQESIQRDYLREMDDIVSKYNNHNNLQDSRMSEQSSCSVEELLIINNKNTDSMFSEEYAAKMKKEQDLQKQRWEEAKKKLGSMIKDIGQSSNIVNLNVPTFGQKVNSNHVPPQPQESTSSVKINPGVSVGYSFANNISRQLESNIGYSPFTINNIQQIKSERSSTEKKCKFVPAEDEELRDIYDKYRQDEEEVIEHIKSVHYEKEYIPQIVEKKEESSPDESFQAKYINSSLRNEQVLVETPFLPAKEQVYSPKYEQISQPIHHHIDPLPQQDKKQSPSSDPDHRSEDFEMKSINRNQLEKYLIYSSDKQEINSNKSFELSERNSAVQDKVQKGEEIPLYRELFIEQQTKSPEMKSKPEYGLQAEIMQNNRICTEVKQIIVSQESNSVEKNEVIICELLPSQENNNSIELQLEDSPQYELETVSLPNYEDNAVEPQQEKLVEAVSPQEIDEMLDIRSSFTDATEQKQIEPVIQPTVSAPIVEQVKPIQPAVVNTVPMVESTVYTEKQSLVSQLKPRKTVKIDESKNIIVEISPPPKQEFKFTSKYAQMARCDPIIFEPKKLQPSSFTSKFSPPPSPKANDDSDQEQFTFDF